MAKDMVIFLCLVAVTIVTANKMEMPSFATAGDRIVVECKLDHEDKTVEHFKWYKDNQMFILVVPPKDPEITDTYSEKIPVDLKESRMDRIVLHPVSKDDSGIYTCELKLEDRMVRMSGTLVVYPKKE